MPMLSCNHGKTPLKIIPCFTFLKKLLRNCVVDLYKNIIDLTFLRMTSPFCFDTVKIQFQFQIEFIN